MATHRKPAKDAREQMLEYLMNKTGMGETELLIAMSKDRIVQLANQGHTIGELLEIAKEEQFTDALMAIRLADLVPSKASKGSSGTSSRLTKAEVERLTQDILAFLKKNPKSSISDIAEGVGFDVAKVRAQLTKLKADGNISTEGTRRDTTYTLVK